MWQFSYSPYTLKHIRMELIKHPATQIHTYIHILITQHSYAHRKLTKVATLTFVFSFCRSAHNIVSFQYTDNKWRHVLPYWVGRKGHKDAWKQVMRSLHIQCTTVRLLLSPTLSWRLGLAPCFSNTVTASALFSSQARNNKLRSSYMDRIRSIQAQEEEQN